MTEGHSERVSVSAYKALTPFRIGLHQLLITCCWVCSIADVIHWRVVSSSSTSPIYSSSRLFSHTHVTVSCIPSFSFFFLSHL